MQNTSTAFKTALASKTLYPVCKAVIQTALGVTYTLDQPNDIIGPLTTSGKCFDSGFELGAAYAEDCSIALDNSTGEWNNINLDGATLWPYSGLVLADTTKEYVLLGTFIVDAPGRPYDKLVLGCSDRLILLDEPFSDVTISYPATNLQILQAISSHCNVPLATSVLTALNISHSVAAAPVEDLSCRDIVGMIAMMSAGFVRMSRVGELEIITFVKPTSANGYVMASGSRWDFKQLSDQIIISGIKYNDLLYGTDAYSIEIDDCPLIQDGETALLTSIFNSINGYTYTAYTATYPGNPAIDPGDPVKHITRDGITIISVISKHDFKHGGRTTMAAEGTSKSALSYKSQNSKRLSSLVAKIKSVAYTLTNFQQMSAQLNDLVAQAMGYFVTNVVQEDGSTIHYEHDHPLLADSVVIYKKTATTMTWSDNGGATWTGMTASGNILAKILTTIGINAEWINTGVLNAARVTIGSGTTFGTGYDPSTKETPAGAQAKADAAYAAAQSFVNGIASGLQSQIDGSITTFFYAYVPTLANVPASAWTTTALKNQHLGDLFYDTATGYSYRFQLISTTYSWARITDTDVTKALADAAAAQDTADGKRRVFVATPTTPYDVGDLWAGGSAGDLKKCSTARASGVYVAGDWTLASKYTDDTAANAAAVTANAAKLYTDNLANDTVITPDEKLTLKPKWDEIVTEGFPALTNLLLNPDFEVTTGWTGTYGTIASVNGELEYTVTSLNSAARLNSSIAAVIGHKYFVCGKIKHKQSGIAIKLLMGGVAMSSTSVADSYVHISGVVTATTVDPFRAYFNSLTGAVGDKYYADDVMCIDLTAAFGTGLEPTAAQFEAMQTAIGVGKNLFDKAGNALVLGSINASGSNSIATQLCRTPNAIRILPNTAYIMKSDGSLYTPRNIYYYDVNGIFISYGVTTTNTFTTPTNCSYIKATFWRINGADLVPADIIAINDGAMIELGTVSTPYYVPCIPAWFDGTYAYGKIPAQALSFGVDATVYAAKFGALHAYLIQTLDLFTSMTTAETGLVRATWDATWLAYYNARTDLLNAIATKAKTIADSKAKNFVVTPTTPYKVGDTWTDGTNFKKCKTERLTGAYTEGDWENATNHDSTSTVITGGLVTTGSVTVLQGGTVAAGMTGNDAGDTAVRFFAGSTFANRGIAPWRVRQDGVNVWTATIGGKAFVITISPTTGITMTYDGVAVFGVNAAGKVYATAIANPADLNSYGEIGATANGEGLFLWDTTVSALYPYLGILKYPDNDGFCILDKNGKIRIGFTAAGNCALYDDAGHLIFWSQKVANFTQIHLPSATDNAIGVDATNAYRIKEGTKEYWPTFATGSGTSSGTGGADTAVSFGKTFASAPVVVANSINGSYTCRIKSVSTTGFVLVISGASVTFNYIAILE